MDIPMLNMDVSKNRGFPPRWMVKIMERFQSLLKWDDLGG